MLKWPGGWRMFALWLVGMAGWVGQASGQVHGTAGRIQDNTWSCLTPPALWWPALKPVICSSLVNKGGMVMGRNSRARHRGRGARARGGVRRAHPGSSHDSGRAPGTRSLWYCLVHGSLTVSAITLKLRATTIPFWRGLYRVRFVIADQQVSLQRSSTDDPVRV